MMSTLVMFVLLVLGGLGRFTEGFSLHIRDPPTNPHSAPGVLSRQDVTSSFSSSSSSLRHHRHHDQHISNNLGPLSAALNNIAQLSNRDNDVDPVAISPDIEHDLDMGDRTAHDLGGFEVKEDIDLITKRGENQNEAAPEVGDMAIMTTLFVGKPGSSSPTFYRRRREQVDNQGMLPPWNEFCKMLNMRECNRYKRSIRTSSAPTSSGGRSRNYSKLTRQALLPKPSQVSRRLGSLVGR